MSFTRLTTIVITLIVLTINPVQLVKSDCVNNCVSAPQTAHSCCRGESNCCHSSTNVKSLIHIEHCSCASEPEAAVLGSLSLRVNEETVFKIVLSSVASLINVIASFKSCNDVLELAQWHPPKATLYLLNRVLRI